MVVLVYGFVIHFDVIPYAAAVSNADGVMAWSLSLTKANVHPWEMVVSMYSNSGIGVPWRFTFLWCVIFPVRESKVVMANKSGYFLLYLYMKECRGNLSFSWNNILAASVELM